MIKLNCGVSRKVGEPNYGSRGASVNVELELESAAVQNAELLHEKIRKLFTLAKSSVDEELGLMGNPAGSAGAATSPPTDPPPNGQASSPAAPSGDRPATRSQLRAIQAICDRLVLDPQQEAIRMYQRPASQISLAEASKFIDHLKQLLEDQGGQ
jgi:hypothetical protein